MKKQKFTITKHNRANGTSYYTCTVAVEKTRGARTFIESIRYRNKGIPCVVEYNLDTLGYAFYIDYELEHDTRETVLNAIEKYIETRERIDGEKVVSTEIEVIYK